MTPPDEVPIAEGSMYTFSRKGNVLIHRVLERPDITFAEGAAAAIEMRENHKRLALDLRYAGAILDLTGSPANQGPKTRKLTGEMVAHWESAGKCIAVLLNAEQAILVMQLNRIVAESAPERGRVVHDLDQAVAWARGELDLPRTISSSALPRLEEPEDS